MPLQDKAMNGLWKEAAILSIGCILYTLSAILINPVNIVPGSVLGVSVVAHNLLGVPIGVVNLICNAPIMIIVCTSILIDWWLPFFPAILSQHGLLLSVLGGVLMGIGAGLLMRAGGTMGGTTAIGRILQKKHPAMNMGNALFIMDTTVILAGSILLKSFTGLLYSVVYTLVCSKAIDMIYSYKGVERVKR